MPVHAALIILKICGIKYFKIVFLNIYNCVYKIPFSKSGHILMFSSAILYTKVCS